MRAAEILIEEDRVSERVLSGLQAQASRLAQAKPARSHFFGEVEYRMKVTDACRRRQEEGQWFFGLESADAPREVGPIGVMLAGCEGERRWTWTMRTAVQRLELGDAVCRDEGCSRRPGFCFAGRHLP